MVCTFLDLGNKYKGYSLRKAKQFYKPVVSNNSKGSKEASERA